MRDALALVTESALTPAGILSRTVRTLVTNSTDLTELVNRHIAFAEEETLETFDTLVQELSSKALAIGVDMDTDQSGIVPVKAANHAPSNDCIESRAHQVSPLWHHAEARPWRQKWRARRHVWHETRAQ